MSCGFAPNLQRTLRPIPNILAKLLGFFRKNGNQERSTRDTKPLSLQVGFDASNLSLLVGLASSAWFLTAFGARPKYRLGVDIGEATSDAKTITRVSFHLSS